MHTLTVSRAVHADSMNLSPPSRWLERVALGLGLASSVCLAVAAFAAFGNPREAGWSRLNELVSGARENVRVAWLDVTSVEGGDGVVAASPLVSWSIDDGTRTTARVDAGDPREAASATPGSSLLFDALMAASEDAELRRHDLREASALVEEALTKDADADGRARGRLRAIQLAARLSEDETVRAHGRRAVTEIDVRHVVGGTSTILLCALAALPSFPEAERVAFAEPVVRAWTAGELSFPDDEPSLRRVDDGTSVRFVPTTAHVEAEMRRRLVEACGGDEPWRPAFEAYDAARLRRALIGIVGPLPVDPTIPSTHWTISNAGDDLLAVRAAGPGRFVGQLADRARLAETLGRRLRDVHALPAGFVLDFDGRHEALGEAVGVPIELSPALPRATLRHPDVGAVLKQAESRTTWLRAGMLVLALFVAGATAATTFALRRERRLTEARTSFVAGVSHELRTPLASILLMAENLENGRAGANTARYHSLIRREVLRLRRLVDDVLDFSRLERGRRFEARVEDVELTTWFTSLTEEATTLAEQAGVTLSTSHATLPTHAAFDSEAVRRAVLNLVVNALRHSGSPRVDLAAATEDGDVLRLTVADHGKGVPARERESIFEPFARLAGSESTPGAGLGLAIVREIAVAHGGSVLVRDRESGPGAVFELRVRALGDSNARGTTLDGSRRDSASNEITTRGGTA